MKEVVGIHRCEKPLRGDENLSTAGPPKGSRPLCGPVCSYSCSRTAERKASSIIDVNVELPIVFAGTGGWN